MVTLTDVSALYCEAASCEMLYEVRDAASGLLAFIAVHDTSAGPGCGGVRRMAYRTPLDAVRDAVRLAEQMSLKTALAELPCGGAKAVILQHPGLDVPAAYAAFGEAVQALEGAYYCGADVGTSAADLAAVRETTRFVNARTNTPASATARGVVAACRAALAHIGVVDAGFTAAVQGVGSVGTQVAIQLAGAGGQVRVADIDPACVSAALAAIPDAAVVAPEAIVTQDVTLFAPCAVGPVITHDNVHALRCRIVCGGANRQLADPTLAHVLDQREIVYVPDFAINAGAVIEGALMVLRGDDVSEETARAQVDASIDAIGPRVAEILAEARREGLTPLEVALSRAGG